MIRNKGGIPHKIAAYFGSAKTGLSGDLMGLNGFKNFGGVNLGMLKGKGFLYGGKF